jgi:predicted phage baseplate assembly protein
MKTRRCGCCQGTEPSTPRPTHNRPGLETLAYRAGRHAEFVATMRARLTGLGLPSGDGGPPTYPLDRLRTRAGDDASIALLDAWAVVADVLTFYQERIANEGYLRTATERRSVVELGRLVGYQPRPGVAASVYLAFELEDGYAVEVPAGTRAQSVPAAPPEPTQFFETAEPLPARTEWNRLRPIQERPQLVLAGTNRLYLRGAARPLAVDDPLLLELTAAATVRRVAAVTADHDFDRLIVTLQPTAGLQPLPEATEAALRVVAEHLDAEAFGVDPDRATARRILAVLRELRSELEAQPEPAALLAALERAVAQLGADADLARRLGWSTLAPWAGGATAALGEVAVGLRVGMAAEPAPERATTAAAPRAAGAFLPALLEPLSRPPSRQPASPLRLDRDPGQLYAAGSDVGAKLLGALHPATRDSLYVAWGNATVTDPGEFLSAHAFGLRAAPFGHNAPLRRIVDSEGQLLRMEEWPIALWPGSTRVGVRVREVSLTELEATVSIREGRSTLEATRALTDPWTPIEVQLGRGLEATITPVLEDLGSGPIVRRVDVSFAPLDRTIGVELDDMEPISVRIEDSTFNHFPNLEHLYEVGTRSGQIVFVEGTPASAEVLETVALPDVLTLDNLYELIATGGWVLVERHGQTEAYRVKAVRTVYRDAYDLKAKVTELVLDRPWLTADDTLLSDIRDAVVFAASEVLPLATEPVTTPLSGKVIELERLYDGLEPGRWLIVAGERADIPDTAGVQAAELVMVAGVAQGVDRVELDPGEEIDRPGDQVHTFLTLANELAYSYRRDTVTIHGNVVRATHGETRGEVLGSGQAATPFQTFELSFTPLTFVAAPTPSGAGSTLAVRVDEVLWHEAESLVGLGPTDRRYVLAIADDGTTTVTFGDGIRGARVPTGVENVTAAYRQGIGSGGNVRAGQISLLASRPLGVRSVGNPLGAAGGADRDDRDDARANLPLATGALDRLVSVRDFELFARGFAGIGKASAGLLARGGRRLLHLTIAGRDDGPVDDSSDLYRNLRESLHRFGDPQLQVQVDQRALSLLVIRAAVRVHPDHRWESVEPRVRAALLDRLGFEQRAFGQPVWLSEVQTLIQVVPGVAWVDVDILGAVPEALADLDDLQDLLLGPDQPLPMVRARLAGVDEQGVPYPAELVYLSPQVPETLLLTEAPL